MKSLIQIAFLAMTISVGFNLAVSAKEYCTREFCIVTVKKAGTVTFNAVNKSSYASYSAKIDLTLKNMRSDKGNSITFHIQPGNKKKIFMLKTSKKEKEAEYSFKYWARIGNYKANHARSTRYRLPVRPGSKALASQGCNGPYSHKARRKYATDFVMDVGTPIYAARAGTVVDVKQDSSKGGKTKRFAQFANLIMIEHADGTIANYSHLRKNGARVRLGQKVRAGQVIALSGNTGWSTGPHLHFEVMKPGPDLKWDSIRVTFDTKTGSATCPENKILIAR